MDEQPRIEALQRFAARFGPAGLDRTAELDAVAAEALAAFERVGVDSLLLKGRALATLLYPEDVPRTYSDVDLFVAPASLELARGVLGELGYANASAIQGIDDVGGVVHAQTWSRGADGIMIDLHHRFPGSRADPQLAWDALLAHRVWLEVAGRRAPALNRVGQALQLSVHAAQHGPGFAKQTDELALALASWPVEVWEGAAALGRTIEASEAFGAGLRLLPGGAELASRLALPMRGELDWAIRHRSERPRGTFHLGALSDANTWRGRAAILRRSLLPGRRWMIHQHEWAGRGPLLLLAAYVYHFARAPLWALRAWTFRRRARRSAD